MAKWDAEVRKSLATKKSAGSTTLSKQDQALVNAQLAKEAERRQHVKDVKERLERGLSLIHSIIVSGVPEFRAYMSAIANLMLDAALGKGFRLVGNRAFDTYLVWYWRTITSLS